MGRATRPGNGVWALATNQLHLQRPLAAISTTCSFFSNLQLFLQLAAATCSNINHLQLFLQFVAATCSDYLQRPLAATTCSAKTTSKKIHKNLNMFQKSSFSPKNLVPFLENFFILFSPLTILSQAAKFEHTNVRFQWTPRKI